MIDDDLNGYIDDICGWNNTTLLTGCNYVNYACPKGTPDCIFFPIGLCSFNSLTWTVCQYRWSYVCNYDSVNWPNRCVFKQPICNVNPSDHLHQVFHGNSVSSIIASKGNINDVIGVAGINSNVSVYLFVLL